MSSEKHLTEMDKLAHLLEHWREHNDEHAANYRNWSEKARTEGKAGTADLLQEAAQATDRISDLFQRALAALQ